MLAMHFLIALFTLLLQVKLFSFVSTSLAWEFCKTYRDKKMEKLKNCYFNENIELDKSN